MRFAIEDQASVPFSIKRVLCNGREVPLAFEFDTDARWVHAHAPDGRGMSYVNEHGEVAFALYRGEVTVEWEAKA